MIENKIIIVKRTLTLIIILAKDSLNFKEENARTTLLLVEENIIEIAEIIIQ